MWVMDEISPSQFGMFFAKGKYMPTWKDQR